MPQYEELGVKYVRGIDKYRESLVHPETVSVAAAGSGTATITVPTDKRYIIKQVNVTKGANTTVAADGVKIDGKATKRVASFDAEATFGVMLTADSTIKVSGSNAGTAAENLTVEVIGIVVDREVLDK